MKYIKPINEFWGDVLKRDLLGETRQEDKFHNKEDLIEYLISEIEKQGKNVVIKNLDVSLVGDLSGLFYNLYNIRNRIKSLDMSGWNTSGIEDMSHMFDSCVNLKSLNLSGWDTSKVENMNGMFYGCRSLKSLDLSGWDTSRVRSMDHMFDHSSLPYDVVDNKIVSK